MSSPFRARCLWARADPTITNRNRAVRILWTMRIACGSRRKRRRNSDTQTHPRWKSGHSWPRRDILISFRCGLQPARDLIKSGGDPKIADAALSPCWNFPESQKQANFQITVGVCPKRESVEPFRGPALKPDMLFSDDVKICPRMMPANACTLSC
jgi:hypothetical protein